MRAIIKLTLNVLLLLYSVSTASVPRRTENVRKVAVQMIGYSPSQVDDYVAVQVKAQSGYIVGFEPMANADRVHHMILYGCEEPASGSEVWKGQQTCSGASHILYAWARNAPNLNLPSNVAFGVGHEEDNIKYFVLQVHYAQPFAGNVLDFSGVVLHMVDEAPRYLAAVLLFVSGTPIPPHMNQFQSNMSCVYRSETEIHPFAFRTHTHAMGRVVSAFYRRNNQWTKIGKRNPQWPQLFESIPDKSLVIKQGDLMAASCRFDSHDKNMTTNMGHMGSNEMCNFYMMFYWDAKSKDPFPYGAVCPSNEDSHSFDSYPQDGFSLLTPRPDLEHHAHQSSTPFGITEEGAFTNIGDVPLGQISGIAFDNNGQLFIFHRGSRVWDGSAFDYGNRLNDRTPIHEPAVVVAKFDGKTAQLVAKYGEEDFYMPHGIYIDVEGDVYTTDVGSHTVAKWKVSGGKLVKVWEFGEKFVPGSDHAHLCKPTGVTRSGDRIFVTDGYCNARVVELTIDGKFKSQFGSPGSGPAQFALPHDVVLSGRNTLIVADRTNGRVQELTKEGSLLSDTQSSNLFGNIYSSDTFEDSLFMIPGEKTMQRFGTEMPIQAYVSRLGTGLIEYAFAPISKEFSRPHVIRVCPTGDHIFVGDISEGRATLWKFKIQHDSSTVEHKMTSSGLYSQAADTAYKTITSASSSPTASIVLFLGIAATIAGCLFYRKKKRSPANLFDRTGFKPLSQEDTKAFFDDSDSD